MGDVERDLLGVAETVAREAAELARSYRDEAIRQVDTKSSETDPVTAADRATERLIRTRLAELRPGEPVLGEEEGGGGGAGAGTVRWVVDPIDGTVNYLYGYPWYAVSVAAQVDGVSVAGVVLEPASGRCWAAERGAGATLDGVPLRVSAAERLDLALVGTGFAYRPDRRRRQAAGVAELMGRLRDIRRSGSAALDLCAVAAGWLDGYFEHGLSRWDWAAGALIAEEAGALVRLPGELRGPDLLLAATPGIAEELTAALDEAGLFDL
ncbi:inositol monophosphatase family protein [Actinophytocola sp.]|uniref:inositol monophosphatase family protein n=1 Tax=Actinophytocola sp. TaxID=1872138 RepID=UPI002D810978|nr:inositol monophosphatase family protein [Actinophytocola sp.]HET9141770.1 inositol monophosphatase family protein [Actinophytocola sp.]